MAKSKTYDFTKLRRLIIIYGIVQVVLVVLLIFMAVNFQGRLQQKDPQLFLRCIGFSLVIQLALFYPVYKFAANEACREVESNANGLTTEEQKSFRSKRLVGDVVKTSIFMVFITFIWKMMQLPQNAVLPILCIAYFTFILTFLNYFQCYNFAAKREMKSKG